MEELAQAGASRAVICDVHTSVGTEPILLFGDEKQKRRWLPPLASGKLLGAVALTEPASGSDAASLQTTARRNGDGYVLNGTKQFCTNGGIADIQVAFATVDRSLGPAGVAGFVIEKGTAGMRQGRKERKLGLRPANHRPAHHRPH